MIHLEDDHDRELPKAPKRPRLTGRVNARHFGYDRDDSTAALAAAIASGGASVRVPYLGIDPWQTDPITWASDRRLELGKGATIKATSGGYGATSKNLIAANLLSNISFAGVDSILEMRRQALSVTSDGPHCLNIRGCDGFFVFRTLFKNGSGDGLYIGPDTSGTRTGCTDGVVRDCVFYRNRRQGISVTAARRLLIENCVFRENGTTVDGVAGASPKCGLDIEPPAAADYVDSITVRSCKAIDNDQTGFMVHLGTQTQSGSHDVSVLFDSCFASGGNFGIRAVSYHASSVGPAGTIEFRNCVIEGTAWQGLWLEVDAGRAHRWRFVNCVLRNVARSVASPIAIDIHQVVAIQSGGGVEFVGCVLEDDQDRRPVIFDHSSNTLADPDLRVWGEIEIRNPLLGTSGLVDCGIPNLRVSLPDKSLRAWPTSDVSLKAVVNMQNPDLSLGDASVITDLEIDSDIYADHYDTYYTALNNIKDHDHHLLDWTGRYISGRRVEGDSIAVPHDRWPHEAVDVDVITPAYLGFAGNDDWVDISNAAARLEFGNAILDQADAAFRPILFVDNLAHPGTLPTGFVWADTCAHIKYIRRGMEDRGGRVVCNISGVSYAWSAADTALIIDALGNRSGLSFELFWHPNLYDPNVFASAATRITNTQNQINSYRRFLDSGLCIVGIPVAQGGFTQAENGTFQCACAMMAWEVGDPLFVCVGQSADYALPTTLGAPTADAVLAGTDGNFLTYSREFEGGTLEIDTETRTYQIV